MTVLQLYENHLTVHYQLVNCRLCELYLDATVLREQDGGKETISLRYTMMFSLYNDVQEAEAELGWDYKVDPSFCQSSGYLLCGIFLDHY